MNLKDYRTHFIQTLTPLYDAGEAESFFYLTLENRHGLKRVDLVLQPDFHLSDHEIQDWNQILDGLIDFTPIQYLLGRTEFYGLEFQVNGNTLIPRPETEELVQWILFDCERAQRTQPLRILDIGTGSGCIAIALAKNLPDAMVSAIDVSPEALEVAARNAVFNGVKVQFLQQDILETTDLATQYDIIVSNPPYVRELEKQEIKPNVLEHEPHLALFVADDDALVFYKKITQLALKHLPQDGKLYFEINQYLGTEMVELLKSLDFKSLNLRKDIYGNDRMLKADR
ncbi:MAG TPA: peptide chain release factor N(5)-glutamine methyltransferase [Flavobacterium sp.]|nr:peptide chain release factor N(5)-glutamine methyltransferase [Flavobacterium sp.]HPJ09932.1 peptide chain release factor N(5)-glutamine methyltransferase [Flavobacterium sp.]